jgi:hypothetical protein
LHYAPRNSPGRRTTGLSGVEHKELLDRYAASLDRAYEHFLIAGWETPVLENRFGAVPVLVLHGGHHKDDPATFTPRRESTVILRSLIPDPRVEAMLARAEVDAAHEVCHVFTHRHHPPLESEIDFWRWFDEATAVFTERSLCRHVPETVRFGVYWCYRPEMALTKTVKTGGGYFAAWFVHYLADRFGANLIRDAWHAADYAGPVAALDALLQRRHGCGFQEVFEAYTYDTYLYRSLAPDVHERFGERSIAEWFEPALGRSVGPETAEKLDPFACRYYRFNLPAGAKGLRALVTVGVPPPDAAVRAALLSIPPRSRAASRVILTLVPAANDKTALEGTLEFVGRPEHVVLVVSNVPQASDNVLYDFFALQDYTFEVTVF